MKQPSVYTRRAVATPTSLLLFATAILTGCRREECDRSGRQHGEFVIQVSGESLCALLEDEYDYHKLGLSRCDALCADRPDDFPYQPNGCRVQGETDQRLRKLSQDGHGDGGERWCEAITDTPVVEVACVRIDDPPESALAGCSELGRE